MEKIIKRIGYAILFILCLMFIIRCFMVADKSIFSKLYVTDAVEKAVDNGTDEFLKSKVNAEISDNGHFRAYAFYYVPDAGEAQLTIRWNDSAYKYTGVEAGSEFSFVLVDETTGKEYPMTVIDAKKRSIYNYRKYKISDVEFSDADLIKAVMVLSGGERGEQIVKHAEEGFTSEKIK